MEKLCYILMNMSYDHSNYDSGVSDGYYDCYDYYDVN